MCQFKILLMEIGFLLTMNENICCLTNIKYVDKNKEKQERIAAYILDSEDMTSKNIFKTPISKSRSKSKSMSVIMLNIYADMYMRNSNDSIENTPFSSLQLSNINQQTESYSTINKQDCQNNQDRPNGILKVLRDKPLIDILNMTKSTLSSKCIGNPTKDNDKSTSRSRSKSSVFRRLYQKAVSKSKNCMFI